MSEKSVKVSVGLVAYNQEQYVADAINSIFRQTWPIDRLVICDDCSTDRTWEVIESTVKRWQANIHRVREVITQRNSVNLGYLRNFQEVVRLAGGDLFVYQAGDDISLPHRVEKLVRAYIDAGSPELVLLHSSVYVDKVDSAAIWRAPSRTLSTVKDFALSLQQHIGASEAFDPRLLYEIGEIKENTYDDLILGFRAALLKTVIEVDEPLLIYRRGGISSQVRFLDNIDWWWVHSVGTYRQRLADAKIMGQRAAEKILRERLMQLGCLVDLDDCGCSSVMVRKPSHRGERFEEGASIGKETDGPKGGRRKRILIVSEVPRSASEHRYRLARFDALQRSGVDVDVVWLDLDSDRENHWDLCEFDIIWIAGFPVKPKIERIVEALEALRSRCVVWEIDHWLDERRACHEASLASRYAIAQRLVQLSSVIVASDEYLAKWVGCRFQTETIVVPDLVPLAYWPAAPLSELSRDEGSERIQIGLIAKDWSGALDGFVEKLVWSITSLFSNVSIKIWGAVSDVIRGIPGVTVFHESTDKMFQPDGMGRERIDIALMPILCSEMLFRPILTEWLRWSAAGVPVVASRVPRLCETIDENLMVVTPNDIGAWCAAIRRCIEDLQYRKSMAVRARAFVYERRMMRDHLRSYIELVNEALAPELRIPEFVFNDALEPLPLTDVGRWFHVDRYRRWCRERELREVDGETLAERVVSWGNSPSVLFITVASTPEDFSLLSVTAASLGAQFYDGWRWLILSDQPPADLLFETLDRLAWWQLPTLDSADAVASAIASAVDRLACDWVSLLLPGTYVHPQATIEVIDRGFAHENVVLIYHDHDHWDEGEVLGEGDLDFEWLARRRCEPYFKPELDRLWLLQADYIGAAVWWRANRVKELMNEALPGAWWNASVLVAADDPATVYHIPQILTTLPLRCSMELQSLARPARQLCARRAVRAWFPSLTIDLKPSVCPRTLHLEITSRPLSISIVLVLQDVHFQSREAIEALQRQIIEDDDVEIIVVSNRVRDPDTISLLMEWRNSQSQVYLIDDDQAYDLVRLYAAGARLAKKDICVFMHADVVPIDPRAVGRLARDVLLANGGMVGPVLLRPESMMVDSAGLAPGGPCEWQVAHELGPPLTLLDHGPWDILRVLRAVPAVDPVFFAIRRQDWYSLTDLVGELHVPQHFAVEAALRLRARGGRMLISPYARAAHRRGCCGAYLHATEKQRGEVSAFRMEEAQGFWRRYGRQWSNQPSWPQALSLRGGGWQLDDVAPVRWPRENARRPRVLGYSVSGGSGEYRVKSPLRALAQVGLAYTEIVDEHKPVLLTPAELLRLQPNTVLLHQWLGKSTAQAIDNWRQVDSRIRIVLGLDDRNDAVPEKSNLYVAHRRAHPDARAKLRRMAERCDAVIVSTPPLQAMLDELGVHGPSVHVIPNALGRDRWGNLCPPRRNRSKPRVGWIGALQHRGDLEFLIPVIRATHELVDWVFMGMALPEVRHHVAEVHRWVSYDRYPEAIADLDLDLAVAPLEYNIFNECKSNLRLLEYGAAGYPVICTDITPYRENSPPVTRLENNVDLWIDAIRSAVADLDALRAAGEELRRWVWTHYDLAFHLESWQRVLAGDGQASGLS